MASGPRCRYHPTVPDMGIFATLTKHINGTINVGLYDTFVEIFHRANRQSATTNRITNKMAEERFMAA